MFNKIRRTNKKLKTVVILLSEKELLKNQLKNNQNQRKKKKILGKIKNKFKYEIKKLFKCENRIC